MSEARALLERVTRVAEETDGRPVLVGLAGAPGAGKSTVAALLVEALAARGLRPELLPMDGYHLSQHQLGRLCLADRKGAPETFDADGYVRLLASLREGVERTVYAPGFDRHLEEPIAAVHAVGPETRVVVTEGNYLLLDAGPWAAVRPLLDVAVHLDLPDDVRRQRLVDRHVAHGRSRPEAEAWVAQVDEPNARLVDRFGDRADTRANADALARGLRVAAD